MLQLSLVENQLTKSNSSDTPATALVTGGAGFLGFHLCDRLLSMGTRVICLDNFTTGKKSRIDQLSDHPNFKFIRGDVMGDIEVDATQIFHLACPASVAKYQKNPINTLKTSVIGTSNLLDLAVKNNAQFLQASTSEIYGSPKVHPQNEEYWGNVNPIGIRACYDEGKRVAETLCYDYYRHHDLSVKIIRIFNTFGPQMAWDDGRVISNFITQALENKPITVYGDGAQTRSFCYVTDLIDGMIQIMSTPKSVTGPVNLGGTQEISMLELANKIKDLTNSTSGISFKPLPQDDPPIRRPDVTRAKRLLDWEAKTSLNDGLVKTIAYFKESK